MTGKCTIDILLWAGSNWGKTSQIFNLADWLWRERQLKTRLVSCSGGGWEVGQPWVDAGIVQATHLEARPNTRNALDKLTKGYWPANPADPNSTLMPPPWEAGKLRNVKCQTQQEWDEVGLYAFDSLSEICEKLKRHFIEKSAAGDPVAADVEKSMTKFRDGEDDYGVATRGTVGVVQDVAGTIVAATKSFSGKIILWTALESIGEEKRTKNTIFGPMIAGTARTDAAKAWCSNCWHGEEVKERDRETRQISSRRVLWLKTHYTGETKMVAKNSANFYCQSMIPDRLEGDDLEFPAERDGKARGVVKALELIEQARSRAESLLQTNNKQGEQK